MPSEQEKVCCNVLDLDSPHSQEHLLGEGEVEGEGGGLLYERNRFILIATYGKVIPTLPLFGLKSHILSWLAVHCTNNIVLA